MDSRWFKPPTFRSTDDGGEHRQATWLELFFDLVFVVAVAELSGLLLEDVSAGTLVRVNLLFLPLWWLWMDYSYYGDQFDADDVVYRLSLLAAMFLVVVLSRTMSHAVEGDVDLYGFTMAALYAVLLGLYLRALRSAPEIRAITRYYVGAMAASAALWLGVALVGMASPLVYVLGGIAVLVPMLASPVGYWRNPDLPSQLSHMPERFGLFVIILLGESVTAVAAGIARITLTPSLVAVAAVAFTLGAALWWTYFIRSDSSAITHALEGERGALMRSFVYGYGHLPILAGIGAAGVGAEEAILAAAGEHAWAPGARLVLGVGVAAALGGMAVSQRWAPTALPWPSFAARLAVAGLAVAVGAGVGSLGPVATLGVLTSAAVGLAVGETLTLPHPSKLPNEPAWDDG